MTDEQIEQIDVEYRNWAGELKGKTLSILDTIVTNAFQAGFVRGVKSVPQASVSQFCPQCEATAKALAEKDAPTPCPVVDDNVRYLQIDRPFPWRWEYVPDETRKDPDARVYSAEPVIFDARGSVVVDTHTLEDLGPAGRIWFAAWVCSETQAEAKPWAERADAVLADLRDMDAPKEAGKS